MNLKKIKNILNKHDFFNKIFYLKTYQEARLADDTPLDHFCKIGLENNLKPNENFDPIWYKSHYQDIKKDGGYPVIHFLLYGKKENRFQNKLESIEYEKLITDNKFDINFYKKNYQDLQGMDDTFDCVLHYVRYGQYEGRIYQPESKGNDITPQKKTISNTLTTIKTSLKNSRNKKNKEITLYDHLVNKNISWEKYFEVNTHHFVSKDPILDYVKTWRDHLSVIPDYFDTNFYLESYPDIKESDIIPVVHFIEHGANEGRAGIFNQDCLLKGNLEYLPSKETVVFVSHESSATGAPLLGYNIINSINEKFNVIHFVIRKGNIKEIIKDNCFLYVEDVTSNTDILSLSTMKFLKEKYNVKVVILNSVETFPILHISSKLRLATVSLIHEFAEYTRPIGKMVNTLFYATKVITPASIIKNSMLGELKQLTGIDTEPKHLTQLPQGKLPFLPDSVGYEDTKNDLYKKFKIEHPAKTKIIVGTGYVQIRKGVDLFLSTARYIKQKSPGQCKFVWVGDGYDPEHDFACSVWLKRDIKFYGLEDDFFFLEHQKNLDTVFNLADIFCLTSRMDPFPNVAIDAMEKNLPIACFKDASGTEEFLKTYHADYLLAEYLDTHDLADKIVDYLANESKKKTINSRIVEKELDFENYIKSIIKTIDNAKKENEDTLESVSQLLKSNIFDPKYYGLVEDNKLAAYHYVSLFKKGLHKMSPNPKPGFSQMQWMLEYEHNERITPLEQAIEQGKTETHTCLITPINTEIEPISFKYAVHLHLYYIDLAIDFNEYFKNLIGNFDLYITIIASDDTDYVYQSFESCGATNVEVLVVENIGRDVGPMIFDLRKKLMTNGYEVIGHFHSKKSLSTDGDLGNRWREYLMHNLCGNDGIATNVLSQFNDPKIGLVFADDKHIIDIGDNQQYIDNLCQMLDLPRITSTHVFPLGNMFWARIDAIKQYFELDPKTLLQPEPLPYDGSYMHAIERITPNLVQKNGYKFVTVYKKGSSW